MAAWRRDAHLRRPRAFLSDATAPDDPANVSRTISRPDDLAPGRSAPGRSAPGPRRRRGAAVSRERATPPRPGRRSGDFQHPRSPQTIRETPAAAARSRPPKDANRDAAASPQVADVDVDGGQRGAPRRGEAQRHAPVDLEDRASARGLVEQRRPAFFRRSSIRFKKTPALDSWKTWSPCSITTAPVSWQTRFWAELKVAAKNDDVDGERVLREPTSGWANGFGMTPASSSLSS